MKPEKQKSKIKLHLYKKKIEDNIAFFFKYFGKFDRIRFLTNNGLYAENIQNGETGRKIDVLVNEFFEVGTASDYVLFMQFIEQSLRDGRIPIIDRKSFQNASLYDENRTNTWEIFFEQPIGDITLDSITKEDDVRKVYVSRRTVPSIDLTKCNEPDICRYWRHVARKYARFNREKSEKLSELSSKLVSQNSLGVYVRMGYEQGKWAGHPKQPRMQMLISDIKNRMEEWRLTNIFLVHDIEETYEELEKAFPGMVSHVERKRPDYDSVNRIGGITFDMQIEKESDYLDEIYCLSKCNSVLGSNSSGMCMAFLLSEGFEHVYIYNLGSY